MVLSVPLCPSVCWGCCTESRGLGGPNGRSLFLPVWRLDAQDQGAGRLGSPEATVHALQVLPAHWSSPAPLWAPGVSPSSREDPSRGFRAHPLISLTVSPLQALPPRRVTFRLRASTYKFQGNSFGC